MRLFVALDIDEEIRDGITRFMEQHRALAPKARWVSPESLHVTLKFIGEKPDGMVSEIQSALASVSAGEFRLAFRGSGFFPTPKSARVFWVGIEAEPGLAELAGAVDSALARLGVPKETRPFSPHLTLARAGNRSGAPRTMPDDRPNKVFAALQQKIEAVPEAEFGTMVAREFFLYRSQLSSQGARYSKIARFGPAHNEA
jgi:RNA 2',3'-cyclic 3'-phosphodiesterase